MASLIFDLDGTLIDSVPDVCAMANRILKEFGAEPLSLGEARQFIGEGTAVFVHQMMDARAIDPMKFDRVHGAFLDSYDGAVSRTLTYPGVADALIALRAEGHRLAICTNKPESPARAVLQHLDLLPQFDLLIGGDTLPQRKPDPAPLLRAAHWLGGDRTFFIGDSEIDAATAEAADIPFLLFTGGYLRADPATLRITARFARHGALPGLIDHLLESGNRTLESRIAGR